MITKFGLGKASFGRTLKRSELTHFRRHRGSYAKLFCTLPLLCITGAAFSATPSPGMITTLAGNGASLPPSVKGGWGDGLPATQAPLNRPNGVVLDAQGNIYYKDVDQIVASSRIRKIDAQGILTTVAGGATSSSWTTFPRHRRF